MAFSNAATSWISNQVFSPDEIRRQAIANGMFTITLPETLDRKSIEWPSRTLSYTGVKSGKDGANQIGDPKAPSSGGQGEIKPQQIISRSRTAIEVSLAKAIYSANQIFGSLLNSVNNDNNDFASWERRFEKSIVNKAYMDLVSETIIDDTYNHLAENLFSCDWLDTVSVELSRCIVESYNEIPKETPETVTNDLVFQVKKSLLEKVLPMTILVSEKSIAGYKFNIDTTDISDNNNIRLAREIAEKVYELLPGIAQEVQLEIEKTLGEK
jgi:hypothetical protein